MSKIEYVAPIPKKDIKSLSSDTITKKKHDELLSRINDRFNYVIHTLMEIQGRKLDWYDYANLGEGDDEQGEFDPEMYAEEIEFSGKFDTPKNCLYYDYLPTKWLSEDFEDALRIEIADHKLGLVAKVADKKKKAQKASLRKKELKVSIRQKLTKEELACIAFK